MLVARLELQKEQITFVRSAPLAVLIALFDMVLPVLAPLAQVPLPLLLVEPPRLFIQPTRKASLVRLALLALVAWLALPVLLVP